MPLLAGAQSPQPLLNQLERVDPRRVQVVSPAGLFERQQSACRRCCWRRVGWPTTRCWAAPSVPDQLKRAADLVVAASLLLLCTLLLLAMGLIWLDDPGPVFYHQQRSG